MFFVLSGLLSESLPETQPFLFITAQKQFVQKMPLHNLNFVLHFYAENLNTLTQKNTSNHHYQLIPGLHQCWGGQGKQSCRLAPPGELLKVFAGHN